MKTRKKQLRAREHWENSDWFRQWEELAHRDYHGKRSAPPLTYPNQPRP